MNRLPTLALVAFLGATVFAYRPHAVAAEPTADKKAAANKTGISWKIEPAHVVVFLDGKKLGEAGSLGFTTTGPGKHSVKLTKGDDETEMDVTVKKGEVLQVSFSFDEG